MDGSYSAEIRDASRMFAKALLKQETGLGQRALELDGDVRELLRELGRSVVEQVLGTLASDAVSKAQNDGLRVHRKSNVTVTTIFGPFSVASPYLRDRATRRCRRPVRDELGLFARPKTVAVTRALTDFGHTIGRTVRTLPSPS